MGVSTAVRSIRQRVELPGPLPADGVSLRVRDVTVTYGDSTILDSIHLDVRDGELLALVGPNGAGKSTLLSVLSGDVRPDRGTVEVDGRDVGSWTHVELAMRRAVLLQQLSMSFPFTVRQTVEMGRSPWSGHEQEDDDERRVMESMAATDVTGKIWAAFFPIMAFVASGFEHSVANMHFLSLGMLLRRNPGAVAASGLSEGALSEITLGGYLHNLLPVTLGNIVGGVLFIAVFYYFIYKEDVADLE